MCQVVVPGNSSSASPRRRPASAPSRHQTLVDSINQSNLTDYVKAEITLDRFTGLYGDLEPGRAEPC
jgi:hypothetical protein